jgi:carbon-monoxide dehydrogenase small subunit
MQVSLTVNEHGLQCDYCTPGFLMLGTYMAEADRRWSDEQIKDALASNICRCTGYVNIVKAVTSVLEAGGKYQNGGGGT